MKVKPLEYVNIKTKDTEYTGTVLPNEENPGIIILKLDSGYNVGIKESSIFNIKKEKIKKKEINPKHLEIKTNPNLKKVIYLHTGGTIASKVDYKTGGVIAQITSKELIEKYPELLDIVNLEAHVISNMMSEDMNFNDYKTIINGIKKYIKDCDGIIIGHGTDTLSYTAAALSFAIENCPIPIIMVGSQRSSDRPSSDAYLNLESACKFIAETDFKGVAVCMHNSTDDNLCAILPPTRCRKLHTTKRDAFKAINDTPIALVGENIQFLKDYESPDGDLRITDKFSDKVGMLKSHPNMSTKFLELMTKNHKAIVVEGTGLGHLPTNTDNNKKNYEVLKKYIKKGGIVAMTSQCISGRVNPYVYTNLRRLSNIGVIFCEDMISETAYIKLSWLLGNYNSDKVKELLNKNLRGEISKRSTY